MKVYRAVQAKLYPNLAQIEWLIREFGDVRYVWNQTFAWINKNYQQAKLLKTAKKYVPKPLRFPNISRLNTFLTYLKSKKKWLKYAESRSLQCELRILHHTFEMMFQHKCGYPKFKSRKSHRQSYTTSNIPNGQITVHHSLKLAKLGHVKAHFSSKVTGKIKKMVIVLRPTGSIYASLVVQCDTQPLQKTGKWVGIDVGLDHLLNLSDGKKFDFKRYDKALSNKQHYWSKRASRRRREAVHQIKQDKAFAKQHHLPSYHIKSLRDYHNYQKARIMSAKYHAKVRNQTNNYLQWLTTYLVRHYDIICIEDLPVSKMVHNHHLSRAIAQASWRTFRLMLAYKCKWYGKALVTVDKNYTSQYCHYCHTWCGKKDLGTRSFYCKNKHCPYHYMKLDRDINAAKNILALGLRQIAPETLQSLKHTRLSTLYVNTRL